MGGGENAAGAVEDFGADVVVEFGANEGFGFEEIDGEEEETVGRGGLEGEECGGAAERSGVRDEVGAIVG